MKPEAEDISMVNKRRLKLTVYISVATVLAFVCLSAFRTHYETNRLTYYYPWLAETRTKYAIVFDGGSTGTRIHIFTFLNSSNGLLTLKNAYFEEVKPGLSNFANKPVKAGKSVLSLLEKAKVFVPSEHWDVTPVVLKATAGLRLLPKTLSDSILEEVSKVFQSSPFLADEKSVEVLDGEDEGLYAWYTLNFLLGKLNDSSQSVASLDLGGGSTQVTFTPVELETFVQSPKEHIVLSKILNKPMSIYTHSYLGQGLMSARLSILKLNSDNASHSEGDVKVLSSSCISPTLTFDWSHGHKDYIIKGSSAEEHSFENCFANAVKFLGKTVDSPVELQKREIYALSYYYDRAFDLGLIGDEGGVIEVGDFVKACKKSCSNNAAEKFLCLDCSYISALLQHGLGLEEKKQLRLVKQIDGIETSWGLGAAFNMLL